MPLQLSPEAFTDTVVVNWWYWKLLSLSVSEHKVSVGLYQIRTVLCWYSLL